MVTWSEVMPLAHGPLFKVHWNTLVPMDKPLTPLVGLPALLKVPVPLTTVHVPVAGAIGELPASVAVAAHTFWSGPAFAFGLAGLNTVTFTSSCEVGGTHGPLVMVQRKVFTPAPKPLTVVVALVALPNVPLPATTVHCPVAGPTNAVPVSVVLVAGAHNCWSAPALAEGCALLKTNTVIWSFVGAPQGPLLIVQRKVFAPKDKPVTAVVGLFALVNEPVPEIKVQVPTAGATALLAASVTPVLGKQMLWSGPALAGACAGLKLVMTTSSLVVPHVP